MAQNHQQLPPSKRFKILNSEEMSQPLRETDKHNRNSLPTKKRTEVLASASMSSFLPAKKQAEVMNSSSTSSSLPAKKRLEIDLNTAPSTFVCIPAKKRTETLNCLSTSACLPAKKRAEILNSSSTSSKKCAEILNCSSISSCLPAKKRIWASHQLSSAKSDTQAQGADSLVEEKGRVKDGDASNGVPVKKRRWARILVSPSEPKAQAPVADQICADAESQSKGGEDKNRLPAKKRVWILNPLTQPSLQAKVEVPDLNSVPENDQINDAKELNEIHHVSDLSPLSAILEDTTEKLISAPNPLSASQVDTTKKPVSAPNPLSAVQEDTPEKPVSAPNLLSAVREDRTMKLVSAPNLLSAVQEDKKMKPVSAPNLLSAIQEDPMKKRALSANLSSALEKDTTKKRVSSPNLLSAIHEDTTKKRVSAPNPSIPSLLGFQKKDQTKGKGAKETHGVPAKKRVSTPNPSSATQDVTAMKRVKENLVTSAVLGIEKEVTNLKSVQEQHSIKNLKEAKDIQVIMPKKRVWALNLLSLIATETQVHVNNGEAINEVPSKKKVRYVHPLSPIAEDKDQTQYKTKIANEITTVLVKKRIRAPEPLATGKTQIEQHIDPKPVELGAENEFQMDGGDEIYGDPLMQVCAKHPLSPAKTETQNEEKGPEYVEEEVDDGVICAVCQSTDGDPSDPIVFCDGCNLMVHASCYGNPLIKSIPDGDWFCSSCSSKTSKKEKKCCLCPVKGGALKPTVDGKWAHVMCALLVPEVFFQDPEGRDGIDCSRVPHKRWQKDCFICGRNYGCAIDCAESKCKLGFHVSCGLEEGLSIEYKEEKGGDIVAGFCTEHTKLWKKQQLTGKFKIVSKD